MTHLKSIPVILLADDDADDRLLVRDSLAECNFPGQVHFVEDGEELMNYLTRQGKYADALAHPSPGLVLLDLNMPRKSGREALREIKSDPRFKRIPVVVFSTSQADADIAATYELGANAFVTKPTSYHALVNVMNAVKEYWFEVVRLPAPFALPA
jgi:CheY-like chemotaxis protein